ncbi:MAG: gamma-glutamyltransferase, partial [Gammaproteobacteria bacterium]|nr:gamma-glutamyltransferase [Gammaproteobacteria bacterium]
AAERVLQRGGAAIDAAIAAQMVLGLVEPQSSGLGGGGFLLYWDAANKRLHSYDGRETAPLAATENLFIDAPAAQPMPFAKALVGGRSVGVPGLVHMLGAAHAVHGSQPWPSLFDPAIALAEQGFIVSPRLATLIDKVPALTVRPTMAAYLHPHGQPLRAGDRLRNAGYAATLRTLAEQGANAFYTGALAAAMVDIVASDSNAGQLALSDLSSYRSREREPVCKEVFAHTLCGMGPPSSGATTVLAMLAMLEHSQQQLALEPPSVTASVPRAHAFIEASRLAFADRNRYLADPDFIAVPVPGLLDPVYLAGRAALIDSDRRSDRLPAGTPPGTQVQSLVTGFDREVPSTTHLTIVDRAGNVASMTTSIESAFGSRLMAGGFILNNQLTDFSFAALDRDNNKVANRVQGGKRPLSSMSPFIVFNASGEPVLALGSPGGKSIIGFVARVLYETIGLQRQLPASIADRHVIATDRHLRIEPGVDQQWLNQLRAIGHQPALRAQTSGVHAIQKTRDGWLGVADPRREGTASGK